MASILDIIKSISNAARKGGSKAVNSASKHPLIEALADMVSPVRNEETPTVVRRQYSGQTYGGRYNSKKNLIELIKNKDDKILNNFAENEVLQHELGHDQFNKAEKAYSPLSREETWIPLSPRVATRTRISLEDPRLYRDVEESFRDNPLYSNGRGDFESELSANDYMKRAMRAKELLSIGRYKPKR